MTRPIRASPKVLLAMMLAAGDASAASGATRVQPPAAVACARDQVTSYNGSVLRYARKLGHTELRIRTDWDTNETVRLRHPGTDDPSPWFLLAGQPFQPSDWARIESRSGRLQPGLRVVAWVCSDGRNPLVDWQPPP